MEIVKQMKAAKVKTANFTTHESPSGNRPVRIIVDTFRGVPFEKVEMTPEEFFANEMLPVGDPERIVVLDVSVVMETPNGKQFKAFAKRWFNRETGAVRISAGAGGTSTTYTQEGF
jgi:hypothetical protein